jgi:hypothetical protein
MRPIVRKAPSSASLRPPQPRSGKKILAPDSEANHDGKAASGAAIASSGVGSGSSRTARNKAHCPIPPFSFTAGAALCRSSPDRPRSLGGRCGSADRRSGSATKAMIHRRRRVEVNQSCCRPPAEADDQIQGEPGVFWFREFGLSKPNRNLSRRPAVQTDRPSARRDHVARCLSSHLSIIECTHRADGEDTPARRARWIMRTCLLLMWSDSNHSEDAVKSFPTTRMTRLWARYRSIEWPRHVGVRGARRHAQTPVCP